MAIRVAWDRDDPRIIEVVFEGPWTLREFHAAGERVMALADSRPQPVGVVMDVSAAPQLPGGFVHHAARVVEGAGAQPGGSVVLYAVIGASPVVRAMYHAFFRVFPQPAARQRIVLAHCPDEARALIAARLQVPVEAAYD